MWRSPGAYLRYHCTDYTIAYRDWPRCLTDHNVQAPYEVHVIAMFECRRVIGKTEWQAARRAVRMLYNMYNRHYLKQRGIDAVDF